MGRKRAFKRFWKEWGISLEDLGCILGGLSVIAIPILLYIFARCIF